MSTLINCPTCGKQVSSGAVACPHCGDPVKKGAVNTEIKGRHWVFFLLGGLMILGGIAYLIVGKTGWSALPICAGVFAIFGPFCKLK